MTTEKSKPAERKLNKVNEKNLERLLVKFPIFFPLIYLTLYFAFPDMNKLLAFAVLLLMAEPHFGATWTLFFDRRVREEAKREFYSFFVVSGLLLIMSGVFYFIATTIFYLLFFAFNVYHVSRQSVGVCSLYSTVQSEKQMQKLSVYIINFIIFIGATLYLMLGIVTAETAAILGILIFIVIFGLVLRQFLRFKDLENCLTTLTGCMIFLPAFYVTEPLHAILCGVTMHYSQYLYLTAKIYYKKTKEIRKPFIFSNSFLLFVIAYGALATGLTALPSLGMHTLDFLILIPIAGQILHFYLDGLLWRFSKKSNRELTLKYIKQKNS